MYATAIEKLRNSIKEDMVKAKEIRKRIDALKGIPGSGPERHKIRQSEWEDRRFDARHLMLAYAYLRGKDYKAVEQKTEKRHSLGQIAYFLEQVGVEVPEGDIETWMMAEEIANVA